MSAARLGADLILLVHMGFVLFVVFGGLFVVRWPWLAWLHVPAAAWGALIEFAGWICPLTPLENELRHRAGLATYQGDFVEQYVLPLLYPAHLTRGVQLALGTLVVVVNAAAYWRVGQARRQRRR